MEPPQGSNIWRVEFDDGSVRCVTVTRWADGYLARDAGESPGGIGPSPRLAVLALALQRGWPAEAFLAPGRPTRAEAAAEAGRLRGLLGALVRHEEDEPHSHHFVGTWDSSNLPDIAGKPCARCHEFADARQALGLPRWLPVFTGRGRCPLHADSTDCEHPESCSHADDCGCGKDRFSAHGPPVVITAGMASRFDFAGDGGEEP